MRGRWAPRWSPKQDLKPWIPPSSADGEQTVIHQQEKEHRRRQAFSIFGFSAPFLNYYKKKNHNVKMCKALSPTFVSLKVTDSKKKGRSRWIIHDIRYYNIILTLVSMRYICNSLVQSRSALGSHGCVSTSARQVKLYDPSEGGRGRKWSGSIGVICLVGKGFDSILTVFPRDHKGNISFFCGVKETKPKVASCVVTAVSV